MKRKGSRVVSVMMNSMMFIKESNQQVANMIRQQKFLKELIKRLDCSPNDVIQELEEVRFHLTKPANMLVHMATDLALLTDPAKPWAGLLPPHVPKQVHLIR